MKNFLTQRAEFCEKLIVEQTSMLLKADRDYKIWVGLMLVLAFNFISAEVWLIVIIVMRYRQIVGVNWAILLDIDGMY